MNVAAVEPMSVATNFFQPRQLFENQIKTIPLPPAPDGNEKSTERLCSDKCRVTEPRRRRHPTLPERIRAGLPAGLAVRGRFGSWTWMECPRRGVWTPGWQAL